MPEKMSVTDRDTGASVPQNLQVAHFHHMSSLKCSDFFFLNTFIHVNAVLVLSMTV